MSSGIHPLHLLNVVRIHFRKFRRTRPFWAAMWTMFGGSIIGLIPLSSIAKIVHTGLPGVGGVSIGFLIAMMGLFMVFTPNQRHIVAVITAVLALASFPISNLGGFVVGMLFSLLGASMAFGWMPEKPAKKYRWFRRVQQPTDATSDGVDVQPTGVEPAFLVAPAQ